MSVPQFSMSQISSMSWPFERDIEVIAGLGVSAVGIALNKLRAVGIDRAEAQLREHGLAVSCVTTAGFFDYRDAALQAAQIEDTKRLLADLARINAVCLMLASGNDPTRSGEENLPAFYRILEQLLPVAEQTGVAIAIEPMSAIRMNLSFVNSLDYALDIADAFDSPYLGVTFEVNNAWVERGVYRNIAERWRRFGIVQVNDFKIGTVCTPERVVIGDGDIPLRRIIPAIRDAGYQGYYDIELIGPAIEAEGYESVLPRAVAAYKAIWE